MSTCSASRSGRQSRSPTAGRSCRSRKVSRSPAAARTTSPQIDHIAFKAKDVRAISAGSKAANVKFDRELHDGIYGLTIYVYDPDGNMIELYGVQRTSSSWTNFAVCSGPESITGSKPA